MTEDSDQTRIVMTVDYEEPYHGLMSISPDSYSKWDSILPAVTSELLDIFRRFDVTATFFVLGRVADEHPELVESIADHGHEIASHSYNHRPFNNLTERELLENIRKSKNVLEDISGKEVIGFRAPYFSLESSFTQQFMKYLAEMEFKYDSSLIRTINSLYGDLSAPVQPKVFGKIQEIPISVISYFGFPLPVTGGFYYRFFSNSTVLNHLQKYRSRQKNLPIFYLHPWALRESADDLYQNMTYRERITHCWGRSNFSDKFGELLANVRSINMGSYFRELT